MEVFDISFCSDGNNFVTVGNDCTARLFDTRNLTESSIILDYEEPLVRASWNHSLNSHILALSSMNGNDIVILDIRQTSMPLSKLSYHSEAISNIAWSPESPFLLCSISLDKSAYLWNVENINISKPMPILEYISDCNLYNIDWCDTNDWIGMAKEKSFIMLRII